MFPRSSRAWQLSAFGGYQRVSNGNAFFLRSFRAAGLAPDDASRYETADNTSSQLAPPTQICLGHTSAPFQHA